MIKLQIDRSGMTIHEEGARKTMEMQMENRAKQCEGKLAEIKQLLENPTMREFGFLAGARVLFDSVVTSTFRYSSGAWLMMNKSHYAECDRLQKKLLYSLLRIHSRVTLHHVLYELDLIPWSYEVIREKVSLVTFLSHEKNTQAARLCVMESEEQWRVGLVEEVVRWCSRNKLPDPTRVRLSKETITEAVREAARGEMYEAVATSRFTEAEMRNVNNHFPDYLYRQGLSNHQQKLLFFWKLGILAFKGRYSRMFAGDTSCVYEGCDETDSFRHSLTCPENPVKRPRDPEDQGQILRYLENLHKERMKSCGMPLYW